MSYAKKQQRERAQELSLVEHPSGLIPWELRFCQEYAETGQIMDSIKKVCPINRLNDEKLLRRMAVGLLEREEAKEYILSLQKRLEDMGVASMLEIQMFLTDAIRTPLADIDENSPLCQKKTYSVIRNPDGSAELQPVYDIIPKHEAAKTLLRISGAYSPMKVDVNHGGQVGVMIAPLSESLGDWEKIASSSQEKLINETIEI